MYKAITFDNVHHTHTPTSAGPTLAFEQTHSPSSNRVHLAMSPPAKCSFGLCVPPAIRIKPTKDCENRRKKSNTEFRKYLQLAVDNSRIKRKSVTFVKTAQSRQKPHADFRWLDKSPSFLITSSPLTTIFMTRWMRFALPTHDDTSSADTTIIRRAYGMAIFNGLYTATQLHFSHENNSYL